MARFEQVKLGRCDFLDVLEESVLMGARVEVELEDGTRFEDRIRDVVTEDGRERVIFANHEPIEVGTIEAISRKPLPRTYPTEEGQPDHG